MMTIIEIVIAPGAQTEVTEANHVPIEEMIHEKDQGTIDQGLEKGIEIIGMIDLVKTMIDIEMMVIDIGIGVKVIGGEKMIEIGPERKMRRGHRDDDHHRDRYRSRSPNRSYRSKSRSDRRDDSRERSRNYRSRSRERHRDYRDDRFSKDNDRYRDDGDRYRDRGKGDRRRENDRNSRNDHSKDHIHRDRSYINHERKPNYDLLKKEPSTSVILKGLSVNTSNDQIGDVAKAFGPVEGIRIINHASKNDKTVYGFVDFSRLPDSIQFVQNYSNNPLYINGYRINLDFSISQRNDNNPNERNMDWICPYCGFKNFAKRREQCGSCNAMKPDGVVLCEKKPIREATSVLLVRGLDINTTRETLIDIFSSYRHLKDLRLIKHKITGASRGFCFVEYYTIEDAVHVYKSTKNVAIENCPINVTYAEARNDEISNLSSTYNANYPNWNETPQMDGWEGYSQWNQNPSLEPPNPPPGSDFQYDSSSGYYFDAVTGYYYDSNSGLYYDGKSQTYYNYDSKLAKYVKTHYRAGSSNKTDSEQQIESVTKPDDKDDKVKNTTKPLVEKIPKMKPLPPPEVVTNPGKVSITLLNPTKNKRSNKTIRERKFAQDISRWQRKNDPVEATPVNDNFAAEALIIYI
eukprot:TRINITY_DN2056_c0_g1_i2.p1 TRINITY_DN2056_c0_g1~~TRINITY_DN2056_c0_g1_i2.p1  ORF type:complete len:632 (+),score=119.57 TRINITY_DN2056_c0_g1_i2:57-1952(+)